MLAAKILWAFGAFVFLWLGLIHLLYTFFTDKFSSLNEKVLQEMKSSHPILTRQTTMWNAWIGFNASHSLGGIFIGAINLYLAVFYFDMLQADKFIMLFNIAIVAFYGWLGKRYWFKIPFTGILITFCCFIAAAVIMIGGK